MKFDRTFRLASLDGTGWTIEWDDGIPHMIMGYTAREVMEKALAAVQMDMIPGRGSPK